MSAIQALKRSPLYDTQKASGAVFRVEGGWETVFQIGNASTAAQAVVADASACSKYLVRGRDSAEAMKKAGWQAPDVGSMKTGSPCILGVIPGEYLVLLPAGQESLIENVSTTGASVYDLTGAYAVITLSGPKAEETLRYLTTFDLHPSVFPKGSAAYTSIALVRTLIARLEEEAFMLVVAADYGAYFWETLLDAGTNCGISTGVARFSLLFGTDGGKD